MMSSIVLEAGPNLRIIFDRRADRWGHRIELLDDGATMAAIESVEGSAIDNWPPSPAFQTLDVETRGQATNRPACWKGQGKSLVGCR